MISNELDMVVFESSILILSELKSRDSKFLINISHALLTSSLFSKIPSPENESFVELIIPITLLLTEFKRLFQSVNFKKSLKVLRFLKKSLIHTHPLSM